VLKTVKISLKSVKNSQIGTHGISTGSMTVSAPTDGITFQA